MEIQSPSSPGRFEHSGLGFFGFGSFLACCPASYGLLWNKAAT